MKKYILLISIVFCLSNCAKKKANPFLIEKNRIGNLFKEATVKQLDSIYTNDSIVKRIGEGDYVQASDDQYLIFEKGGKQLLTLTPVQQHDTKEKIKTILINDERFKTSNGISMKSTFKDIRENYTIKNIHNTFRTIIITVENADEYFIIDKKELPEDIRYDINLSISDVQIPDQAKIKYFMIHWEHTKTVKKEENAF